MSISRPGLRTLLGVLVAVAVAVPLLLAGTSGAIYTTLGNGESVDQNIYAVKEDVYLNGGPQHGGTSGLDPANTAYYFMVTDPSGSVLLSTDDIACRQVWVNADGRVYGVPSGPPPAGCTTGYHAVGALNPANGTRPVQLMPYNDTPNSGGEYKVWAIPVADYDPVKCKNNFGFCSAASKTDNFKVQDTRLAYVKVCKFQDDNGNGTQDTGDVLLPHWPLVATGVDGASSVQTGDDGCYTFTVTTFVNGAAAVTITEGTRGNNWTQTAPRDGTYGPFRVSGGVISVTLLRGDDLVAPYFGNYTPGGGDYRLEVTKTAATSYTRTYTWTIDKAVDQSRINTAGAATANYTVEVRHDEGQVTNVRAIGTIKVSNTDPAAAAIANVTDLVDNGGTCTVSGGTAVAIPAGGHVTLDYECTYPDGAVPADGINTATATKDGGGAFSGTAAVQFSKAEVTYVNRSVTVVDSLKGTLGTLDADADSPTTFTYAITFTDPAGTCTDHPNTAAVKNLEETVLDDDSAAVQVCVGSDLNVAKTAVPTFVRRYDWSIDKGVDQTQIRYAQGGSATFNYTVNAAQTGITDSAWGLAGKITVSNPNDWQAITADVTDAVSDVAGACTVTGGTAVVVAAGGSVELDYACTFAAAPAATGTNTGTATWDKAAYFTPNGTATGTAAYAFGTPTTKVNDVIHVTDSVQGPLGSLTATDAAPWASASYTYSRKIDNAPGGTCTNYDNTATITETEQTDSQRVSVCVGVDLRASKTATPSFTRAYLWRIGKAADKTRIDYPLGGSATFNYTVDAAQTGFTDSAWALAGKITVTNPNDWQAITADVTDAVSDVAGVCTVTGGTAVVVAAGGTVVLDYTCTFTAAPVAAGTNTATVAWDKAAFFTPNGTAMGTAAYAFGTPTTKVNDVIHVADSVQGALGSLTATDAAPWASASYTYSRKIDNAPGGTCTNYDNTATITETGQADSEQVRVCVGVDLRASKTATPSFTRTYLWRIGKAADKTRIDYAQGGSATFNYTVDAEQTGFADSAWALAGKIRVSNPNDWQAITADVTDAVSDVAGTCIVTGGAKVAVAASSTVVLDYVCTFAAAPVATGTNTATVAWDKAAYFTPNGTATGTAAYTFGTPTTKVDDVIHVTDSVQGPLGSLTATDAAPWASASYTYSRKIDNAPGGTCTNYDNTATIIETKQTDSEQVRVCVGVDLTASKTAAPSFTRTYAWRIEKAADKTRVDYAQGGSATFNYTVNAAETGFADSAWVLTGTITVTNPNDWQAITADISDVVPGGTCTVVGGAAVSVPAGGTVSAGYTCTFAVAPAPGSNVATVTWNPAVFHTPTGSAAAAAAFAFTTPTTRTNQTIDVTDSYAGPLGTLTATDAEPWTTATYHYTRTINNAPGGTCTAYDNTATITQTGQAASQRVTVCVGVNLTASKTAAAAFHRAYLWAITKGVDRTLVEQPGGSATFNYTVNANQTGITDSGWTVTGTITVTNPNDWQAITANLTDALSDAGGACTVTGGTGVVLAASGSASRSYSCTFAAAPSAAAGTNTATVTWNGAAAFTPASSATATAAYAFGLPTTTTNRTITVTDTFDGTLVTLGTVTGTEAMPWASRTFTYAHTVPNTPVPGTCRTYNNTAAITQTGQSDSESVRICNTMTGARTIGFWQNKNGQGIIKQSASTGGICNLGTWLMGFAPFQDLKVGASCETVAKYVTAVIRAANSAGDSMNPMLKAQMLATALDVYFSDPALGGNALMAPAPIGGYVVDLTHVNKPIGSAYYEDVRAAFGGATSMTVYQMLLFASSQSSVGGTLWYGNAKAIQELAKDAFDAINNEVAWFPMAP